MRPYLFVFLFLLLCLKVQAQHPEKKIRSILKHQEDAWNQGDLDRFMIGYWENDSLLFVGKNGPTYGYTATLNNYKKSYSDTVKMGHFTSTILQIKRIGCRHYIVLGKWYLARSIGDISGHYTLLFRKIKGRWRIVVDHSS